MDIDPRTVRKFEKLQSIPIGGGEGDPAKAREEWFKILTGRIRIAAASENDAAISELIKAGAALLNTPDIGRSEDAPATTGNIPAAAEEPTADTKKSGSTTREDIKGIKPTVLHIPAKKRQEPDDEKGAS